MSSHPFENIKHIFKAYDIRGLLEEVTPELAYAVGYTLVKNLEAKKVVIGRDMRKTSESLLQEAVRGAMAAGAEVVTIGECTTSLYNYAVTEGEDIDLGMMVTASHSPAKYNGIKACKGDGMPLTGGAVFELLEQYTAPEEEGAAGEVIDRSGEILDTYIDHLMKLAGIEDGQMQGVKIIADFGNGMGSVTIKRVLERLGAEAEYLYDVPDATFPNHESNPAKQETLRDLQERIRETGADFGIATDGDADRIGLVDNTGRILRGDQVLGLLVELIRKEREVNKVVTTVNFGWDAKQAIESTGAEVIDEKIGRTSVIFRMIEEQAEVGGETSSHLFFKETNNLESVDYVLMRILKGVQQFDGALSEMVNHLFSFVNSGEINLKIEDKAGTIARVKEAVAEEATKVIELDGLRCEFDEDWWFIIRASNTEPLLRLTVEAKSQELLDEKVAVMRELVGGEEEK